MEVSNLFVCVMGMGVTFFGLICLICLSEAMSFICRKASPTPTAPGEPPAPDAATEIPNRQELVAVISAVLAEELGTDVSAIRIRSLKKIN